MILFLENNNLYTVNNYTLRYDNINPYNCVEC